MRIIAARRPTAEGITVLWHQVTPDKVKVEDDGTLSQVDGLGYTLPANITFQGKRYARLGPGRPYKPIKSA